MESKGGPGRLRCLNYKQICSIKLASRTLYRTLKQTILTAVRKVERNWCKDESFLCWSPWLALKNGRLHRSVTCQAKRPFNAWHTRSVVKTGEAEKKKGDSNLVPGSLQFPFDYSRKWLKGRDVPKEILIKCCCFTIPAFFLLSPISLSFWHLKISNSSISKLFDVCWWLLILLSQDGGMWSQAPRVWRCVAWVFGPSKEFSWESKGTPPPNATATPPRK